VTLEAVGAVAGAALMVAAVYAVWVVHRREIDRVLADLKYLS
jgi:hypothetical protein